MWYHRNSCWCISRSSSHLCCLVQVFLKQSTVDMMVLRNTHLHCLKFSEYSHSLTTLWWNLIWSLRKVWGKWQALIWLKFQCKDLTTVKTYFHLYSYWNKHYVYLTCLYFPQTNKPHWSLSVVSICPWYSFSPPILVSSAHFTTKQFNNNASVFKRKLNHTRKTHIVGNETNSPLLCLLLVLKWEIKSD